MLDLFEQYLLEVENSRLVKTEAGFATYRLINPKTCYITQIYVKPEYRGSKECVDLGDLVVEEAKKLGCDTLVGSVGIGANGTTRSIRMLLDYGMELLSANEKIIYFKKEIQ